MYATWGTRVTVGTFALARQCVYDLYRLVMVGFAGVGRTGVEENVNPSDGEGLPARLGYLQKKGRREAGPRVFRCESR